MVPTKRSCVVMLDEFVAFPSCPRAPWCLTKNCHASASAAVDGAWTTTFASPIGVKVGGDVSKIGSSSLDSSSLNSFSPCSVVV